MSDKLGEQQSLTSGDRESKRLPAEEGIWVLICGDLLVFSLFFILFLVHRSYNMDLFAQSQGKLNQLLGLINTFLLLTSSLFVALGIKALRYRPKSVKSSKRLFFLAALCGCGFVIVKWTEWSENFARHITVHTNEFFMFYFMYTGIHLIHVLVGLIVLAALIVALHKRETANEIIVSHTESGAIFWHMVDLLWVVLFALFYVLK